MKFSQMTARFCFGENGNCVNIFAVCGFKHVLQVDNNGWVRCVAVTDGGEITLGEFKDKQHSETWLNQFLANNCDLPLKVT